jgi:hypothetical protein
MCLCYVMLSLCNVTLSLCYVMPSLCYVMFYLHAQVLRAFFAEVLGCLREPTSLDLVLHLLGRGV